VAASFLSQSSEPTGQSLTKLFSVLSQKTYHKGKKCNSKRRKGVTESDKTPFLQFPSNIHPDHPGLLSQ